MILRRSWRWNLYEPACAEALRKVGIEVTPCRFDAFFESDGRIGKSKDAINHADLQLIAIESWRMEYTEHRLHGALRGHPTRMCRTGGRKPAAGNAEFPCRRGLVSGEV